MNYRLGVVSNWNATLPDFLAGLGLAGYFEVVVASESVGIWKPDPAIFGLALTQMAVAPGNACYVGDSLSKDVLPAAAVGMRPVWLNPKSETGDTHWLVIRKLPELIELLPALAGREAPC
jgi:putative hydrolase of the HAD superfamily